MHDASLMCTVPREFYIVSIIEGNSFTLPHQSLHINRVLSKLDHPIKSRNLTTPLWALRFDLFISLIALITNMTGKLYQSTRSDKKAQRVLCFQTMTILFRYQWKSKQPWREKTTIFFQSKDDSLQTKVLNTVFLLTINSLNIYRSDSHTCLNVRKWGKF